MYQEFWVLFLISKWTKTSWIAPWKNLFLSYLLFFVDNSLVISIENYFVCGMKKQVKNRYQCCSRSEWCVTIFIEKYRNASNSNLKFSMSKVNHIKKLYSWNQSVKSNLEFVNRFNVARGRQTKFSFNVCVCLFWRCETEQNRLF